MLKLFKNSPEAALLMFGSVPNKKNLTNLQASFKFNTMSKNTGVTRKGSGRTKGSFSFVKIPLAELVAKFADTASPIIVSRKWAEQVGFQGLVAKSASTTVDSIEGQTPTTKVAATFVDLDASE